MSDADRYVDGWRCREKKSTSAYCFFPGEHRPVPFQHGDGKRVSWDGQSMEVIAP